MQMAKQSRRPGGGRQARLAARSPKAAPVFHPVWPGMVGGRFRPLADADMRRIYETARDLLHHVGMASAIPHCVKLVTGRGGWMSDDGRLHYPPELVDWAVATAANRFTLHGFEARHDLTIGGERVHFGTAGAAVMILDPGTRSFRHSQLADLYDLARLTDRLEHIHVFVRPCVARDMTTAPLLDLNTAYASMAGTAKPIGVSFFHPDHVREAVAMFDIALGGPGRYRQRPFCLATNTFVVPPLRFAEESCECLVTQVEEGMPINLLSAGQAGATSPAALAGSLVQGLAECLAGLVFINLMSPGHPVVVCMFPFVSDLRTGAMSGGSGEEAVLCAASAQLLNFLGLPSGTSAGMTDSKLPDNQAGYEKGITVALAAAAGANVIYESASMLGSILATSLEAIVIDNDMMGAIGRTVRGVEVSDFTLSRRVIEEVVQGEGHFLGHDQTLELMQKEYIYPDVGDRNSPKDWEEQGSTDIRDRAQAKLRQILSDHVPAHIDRAADAEIRARFDIRLPVAEVDGTSTRWPPP